MHKERRSKIERAALATIPLLFLGTPHLRGVANDGYIATSEISRTERITGRFEARRFEPELTIKARGIFGQKMRVNISDYADRASFQLNIFAKGIENNGEEKRYWVQDILFVNSDKGKTSYVNGSEVFGITQQNSIGILNPKWTNGYGKVYVVRDGNVVQNSTYIYSAPAQPLKKTWEELQVRERLENGKMVLEFRAGEEGKTKEFDKVSISAESGFSDAYIYADASHPAEFGIGGISKLINPQGDMINSRIIVSELGKTEVYAEILRGRNGKGVRYDPYARTTSAERFANNIELYPGSAEGGKKGLVTLYRR